MNPWPSQDPDPTFIQPPQAVSSAETLIRVLLVDDQRLVQRILLNSLAVAMDLQVVGQAESGQQALEMIRQLHPDVALVDIEMPGMDGLATTQCIHQQFPDTNVIVLSSHDDEAYIRDALKAGAKGYLMKTTPAEELAHAIRFVHRGYLQLGPGLFEKLEVPATDALVPSLSAPAVPLANLERSLAPLAQDEGLDEWSGSTRELLDTLPQPWSRGLLYLLLGGFSVFVSWAMLFQVDDIGTARGRIEPRGKTFRLDTPVDGKVASVLVQEGQTVRANQAIMELESELVNNELSQVRSKLDGQLSRLVQLEGVRNQLRLAIVAQQQQNQAQTSEKLALIKQAQQALSTNQVSLPLQASQKLAQMNQAKEELIAAENAYGLIDKRWQKDLAEVKRYENLRREGIVPEIQIVQAGRTADESLRLREQTKADILKAKQRLKEQQSGYDTLMQQLNSDVKQAENRLREQQSGQESLLHAGELALIKSQQQLQEIEAQVVSLRSEVAQAQGQEKSLGFQIKQRLIRAPIGGTIFQLPVQRPGAVLQAGQTVAQIAPQKSQWILRARIRSKDSGFLRVGLPAKLKFDAYPFQTYGVIPGRLSWVSPDSKASSTSTITSASPQPTNPEGDFFELEIELQRDYIQAKDRRIALKPGQTAQVDIITRQRRIIDFFLDPFRGLQQDKSNPVKPS
jgi:hemolysin D